MDDEWPEALPFQFVSSSVSSYTGYERPHLDAIKFVLAASLLWSLNIDGVASRFQ